MTAPRLEPPWLTLDLAGEMPVLSWALNRPGLVPARRIREVKNATRHSHQVLLEDGEVFPVGKTYWPLLRKRLRRETA